MIFEWLSAPPSAPVSAPIDSLDPSIRVLADELLRRSPDALVITDGFRSRDEQDRLYKQGRETPGPIVTNAKPGYSWHNYGLAFDVALLKDGKRTWPEDRSLWERVGALGTSLGLKWGGSFGDLPHFEYHPGLSFEDAMAGKRPAVPSIPSTKSRGNGWAVALLLGLGLGAWFGRGKLW